MTSRTLTMRKLKKKVVSGLQKLRIKKRKLGYGGKTLSLPKDKEKLNELFCSNALRGNTEEVERLLKAGVEVNAKNNLGITTLRDSAIKGYKDIVQLLVDSGADINAKDDFGFSALTYAAVNGNEGTARVLLNAGADIHVIDNGGTTVLAFAAENGHKEVVRLLLEWGADTNAKNDFGFSALTYAAVNGNEGTARVLLNAGADIHAKDDYGRTALTHAAWKGHRHVFKLLLEWGADIDSRDNRGKTAVDYAVENKQYEVLGVLSEIKKLDGIFGRRDLEWMLILRLSNAIRAGNEKLVRFLIGTDVSTILSGSLLNDLKENEGIVKALIKDTVALGYMWKLNGALMWVIEEGKGDPHPVQLLVDAGADVNYKDCYERTALLTSVVKGQSKVVKVLIDAGADVNAWNGEGCTMLMCAAHNRHIEVAQLLLDAGADVNAEDDFGRTALNFAKKINAKELIKVLKRYGAKKGSLKLNMEKINKRLFYYARQGCESDFERLLLKAGADINTMNKSGNTALDIAIGSGITEMIDYLRSIGAKRRSELH